MPLTIPCEYDLSVVAKAMNIIFIVLSHVTRYAVSMNGMINHSSFVLLHSESYVLLRSLMYSWLHIFHDVCIVISWEDKLFLIAVGITMAQQADIEDVMQRSDGLYKEDKLDEAFELLTPFADGSTDNPKMLWKLVRMYYRKSKAASDSKEAVRLAEKGLEISKKAVELGSKNFLCWKVRIVTLCSSYNHSI